MKRTTIWLVIAFLTFIIGLTAAFLFLKFNGLNNQKTELLPDLTTFYGSNKIAEIPVLSFCELSSNPQKYEGKIIRLNATLLFSQEGSYFYDPNCETSNGGISPYGHEEVWRLIERAKAESYEKYGSDELDLTVVGKFKIEPTKGGYVIFPFQFEILQVEKVSKSSREINWEY